MDTGQLIALVSIVVGTAAATLVVAGAWALGRLHERRATLTRGGGPEETAARLARMERMLETLSTDVERLAEEHRPALHPPP